MLNRPLAAGAFANLGHKILSCPIIAPGPQVIGILTLLRAAAQPDFDVREMHVLEVAAGLIQKSVSGAAASSKVLTYAGLERAASAYLRDSGMDEKHRHYVAYLDVDRMHLVNERFGMDAGDALLTRVTAALTANASETTLVSHISGDRYALLLIGVTVDQAVALAKRLCEEIAEIGHSRERTSVQLSASIGVAAVLDNERTLSRALSRAEMACRAAKDRGRGRVELFIDTDRSVIRRLEDVALVDIVQNAVRNNHFSMDAQPIVATSVHARKPKFELLLRIRNPAKPDLSPEKFLLAAERYQLAPAVDEWVVKFVLEALSAHVDVLKQLEASFAVNLSAQSIGDQRFAGFLESALDRHALPGPLLSFEITETAAVSNIVHAENLMKMIGARGYQIALDDFGKGHSSLSYLKSLPISMVKIDGALVRDVVSNPTAQAMITAVVDIARSMNIKTTVECVENEDIRVTVSSLGVDYVQGYAVGRPRAFRDVLGELTGSRNALAI
jgi:Amt family ammonium transporter